MENVELVIKEQLFKRELRKIWNKDYDEPIEKKAINNLSFNTAMLKLEVGNLVCKALEYIKEEQELPDHIHKFLQLNSIVGIPKIIKETSIIEGLENIKTICFNSN